MENENTTDLKPTLDIAREMVDGIVKQIREAPRPDLDLEELAFILPGLIAAEESRYASFKLQKMAAESAMANHKNKIENDVIGEIKDKTLEITKTGKDFSWEVTGRLEVDDTYIALESIAIEKHLVLKNMGIKIGLMENLMKSTRAYLHRGPD